MSRNQRNLSGRHGLSDNLFEKLAETTSETGGLDADKLRETASDFLLGNASVYGAASFYDFLNPEKSGKKAFVCAGSACMLAGTQGAVRQALESELGHEAVGDAYCLGRCYENHAFNVGGHNYSGADAQQIGHICKGKRATSAASYIGSAHGAQLLSLPAEAPDALAAKMSTWLLAKPADRLTELQLSGLRGRGGAGFPIGIKLQTVRQTEADQKYIVCNADEGDPGAFSDRYLLEAQPERVIAGMYLAGYLAGATQGVLYIRAEYPEAVEICKRSAEFFNQNAALQAAFPFQTKIIKAQGAYICGEETALLNSIEGLRAEVRTRPPFPAQYGLYGKPTAVNNVETLACLPYIMEHGGQAFKNIGTAKSSGTKLLSLDSHFNKPGLYEVDMGTPLRTVVDQIGGGFRKPVKALHIGGPLGGLVPVNKIDALSIDFETFAEQGFLLGHASILCIPEDYPLVHYLEHLFAFTAHESCGKCFPCRIGSVRGKELLQKAQREQYKIDSGLWADLLDTLEKGSLCALGGGIPLPVKNAMQYFEAELKPYFK